MITTTVTRTVPFRSCALHKVHWPRPRIAQRHHTFPQYLQARAYGITEAALQVDPRFDRTTADVCGTGHDTVHAIIRALLTGDRVTARGAERRMAQYAVDRFTTAKQR